MKRVIGFMVVVSSFAQGQVTGTVNVTVKPSSTVNVKIAELATGTEKTAVKIAQSTQKFSDQDIATLAALIKKQQGSEQKSEGNMNSGGANALANQLIQEYRKDITQLPEYKNVALPMLREFTKKMPHLGKYIEERLKVISFYIIPARLTPLAEAYTGLPFKSEQPAVQKTFENYEKGAEVFIDESAYSTMGQQRQGRLLIHEVVESIFITPGLQFPEMHSYKDRAEIRQIMLNQRAEQMKATRDISDMIYNSSKYTDKKLTELVTKVGIFKNPISVYNVHNAYETYFGRVKLELCYGNSSALKENNEIICLPMDIYRNDWYAESYSLLMSRTEVNEFEAKVRDEVKKEKDQADAIEKRKKEIAEAVKVRTEELRQQFGLIQNEYATIANGLFGKVSQMCKLIEDKRKYDPIEQKIVELTPAEEKKLVYDYYAVRYYLAEDLEVLSFKSGQEGKQSYIAKGVNPQRLVGPFYHGLMQIMIMDDILMKPLYYYKIHKSKEDWETGNSDILEGKDIYVDDSTGKLKMLSRESFNFNLKFNRLDLNHKEHFEIVKKEIASFNSDYCGSLNVVRKKVDENIQGKFDYLFKFYQYFDKEWRYGRQRNF